jgi:hypothetical protein
MRTTFAATLLAFFIITAPTAHGQIADVSGPGQSAVQPPPQCPRTIACHYAEQNFVPNGYRLQALEVCGANCTTQYWVSAITDGQALLTIDPTRGGAILAVDRSGGSQPRVRTVMASYASTDPACCPSGFTDTTYSWDTASNALVPTTSDFTPADQFPGYDATRKALAAEGWIVASV